LIALATLVLVTSAATVLARTASTLRAERNAERWTAIADGLLRQADEVIGEWLEEKSSSIVLDPEVEMPAVSVLDDAWDLDGCRYHLTITAWDQCGLVPQELARGGSPLRTVLPEQILRGMERSPGQASGLDVYGSPAGSPSPYPALPTSRPTRFGDEAGREPSLGGESPSGEPPIGAYLATHAAGSPRINVNTAPIALVEQSLRFVGRGGSLEPIVAARSKGLLARVTDGAKDSRKGESRLELVASSNAWAFRIDVRVGAVRRSWWAVYLNTSSWSRVQRLSISA